MRFLTYDELQPSMETTRAATNIGSFGRFLTPREIRSWRSHGAFAEYVGVFAVERGEVVGHTFVSRPPYTYPDGSRGRIAGVALVGSRPDRSGRGIARQMIEEVHRREREEGIEHIALWTNRSWGAHGVYERLGYRDVFLNPFAVRAVPRPRGRARRVSRTRAARRTDLPALDVLHSRATRGRVGFTPRLPGTLAKQAAMDELDAKKELIVVPRVGRTRGYARVEVDHDRIRCSELLAEGPTAARSLLDALEEKARGRVLAWNLSPLRDLRSELEARKYFLVRAGWYVFMARSVRHESSTASVRGALGVQDPRWTVHETDRF
ncbi:MAG: GNAT family N-acetyltransferase [Thermoplasmata archaeon]|nr:GNAT family N-acetyltransferase [Thermoplasmata archaeon]